MNNEPILFCWNWYYNNFKLISSSKSLREKLIGDAHDVHRMKSMNLTVCCITGTSYYVAAFNDTVLKYLVVSFIPQPRYICEISSNAVVIISVYIPLYNSYIKSNKPSCWNRGTYNKDIKFYKINIIVNTYLALRKWNAYSRTQNLNKS